MGREKAHQANFRAVNKRGWYCYRNSTQRGIRLCRRKRNVALMVLTYTSRRVLHSQF